MDAAVAEEEAGAKALAVPARAEKAMARESFMVAFDDSSFDRIVRQKSKNARPTTESVRRSSRSSSMRQITTSY